MRVSYRLRRVVSIMLRSGARKCGRVLERMVLCVVLAVGPYVHLASTWHHSHDECSQAFPVFLPVFRSRVLLWTQTEGKNGGGLGRRLVYQCNLHSVVSISLITSGKWWSACALVLIKTFNILTTCITMFKQPKLNFNFSTQEATNVFFFLLKMFLL